MARYSTFLEISPKTFNEIEDWIKAAEATGKRTQFGMNALAILLARTHQAFAMEKSRGPLAPGGYSYGGRRFIGDSKGEIRPQPIFNDAAWKIPVRRITGRYYKGWKVKRIAPGVWASLNDSREAFFIEFGIAPHGTRIERRGGKAYLKYNRRVRRPINKLSLMATLKFAEQTNVEHRVWANIFAPFRPGLQGKYASRADAIANDAVQSLEGMRFI